MCLALFLVAHENTYKWYVSNYFIPHCFDAGTGERYWVHPLGGTTSYSSSFVADGKVYIGTETGSLWVLKTGKELQVLSKIRLKANPITLTAADGVLYIPTQHSLLAIPGRPAAPRTAHIAEPVPPPAQTTAAPREAGVPAMAKVGTAWLPRQDRPRSDDLSTKAARL